MRRPLLHFALTGALLFGAERWSEARWPDAPARAPIVVPAGADRAATEAAIEEEVLLHEALARGFDENDKVVRERLVRVGRFIGLAADGDDATVEREARALGLQRTDPMIRRYLVGMMRLAASRPRVTDGPDEAAVQAYYERHAARYTQPPRLRFTHVYLSADRRGAQLEADAARLLAELRDDGAPPAAAVRRGDAFARGAGMTLAEPQLDQVFGPGFAAALAEAPSRTWVGPLRSSFGLHLVWIEERLPVAAPPLEVVRNRVVHEMLNEGAEERLRATVRALRAGYDVRVSG